MNKTIERLLSRVLLVALLGVFSAVSGCSPSDPDPKVVTGEVIGGRVVAVGNSLTAGFINGGLIIGGQRAGYANLVALQITGESMTMPLVAPPGIGSEPGLGALRVSATGEIGREPIPGLDPTALLLAASQPTPYDNLGVPGALTVDLLQRTEAAPPVGLPLPPNPFFDVVLRNAAGFPPGGQTQLDQVEALVTSGEPLPSTLLLWIGSNDVLGGATSGDPVVGVNVTPPLASQVPSPEQSFEGLFGAVAARVVAMGVPQVAVANIPPVTAAPFFTTVPLVESSSGLPWATDEDDVQYILLPAQSVLGPDYVEGVGSSSLPSSLTLTSAEVGAVQGVIAAYNSIIQSTAAANGWAYVDVNAELDALPSDPQDPSTFTMLNAVFPLIPGVGQNALAAFSLDGIHPSERGAARVANLFLQAINATYGTVHPLVDEAAVRNVAGFEEFAAGRTVPEHFVGEDFAASARALTGLMLRD